MKANLLFILALIFAYKLIAVTVVNDSYYSCEVVFVASTTEYESFELKPGEKISYKLEAPKAAIHIRFAEVSNNYSCLDNINSDAIYHVVPMFSAENLKSSSITKLATSFLYYSGITTTTIWGAALGTAKGAEVGVFAGTMFAEYLVNSFNPMLHIILKPIMISSCSAAGITAGSVLGVLSGSFIFALFFQGGWAALSYMIGYAQEIKQIDYNIDEDWVVLERNSELAITESF